MRAIRILAVGMAAWLLGANSLRAGLYNTAEPPFDPTSDFPQFQTLLLELRRISVPQPPETWRRKTCLLLTRLGIGRSDLTVEERVNLGAALIRLKQYVEAMGVLKQAEAQDRRHFMV